MANFRHIEEKIIKVEPQTQEIFFNAVKNNNIEKVKNIVESEVPIVDTECINDALIIASKKENWEMVKYLVDNGADINAKGNTGETSLMLASMRGNLEIVKYLIEHGADINAKGMVGTALMFASHKDNLEIVKYLVEHGADVNVKTHDGITALIGASAKGHLDIVKYLVENGADINARYDDYGYEYGNTALIEASRNSNLETVKYLVEHGADIYAKDCDHLSALSLASMIGNLEIVKYFIEGKEMDINHENGRGWTILIEALIAANGHLNIFKYLIEHGADVNAKTNDGRTVLMEVSCGGRGDLKNLEVIKYLVEEKGMDINVKDNAGNTALIYAIAEGQQYAYARAKENFIIVKYFLESGADVNTKDNDGKTALMYASRLLYSENLYYYYNEELIDLLIKNKANVNAKDNDGWTALMYACSGDMDRYMRLNIDILKSLIRAGANINEVNNDGDTALIQAIRTYSADRSCFSWEGELSDYTLPTFEIIKLLINNGANVNIRNKKGETPLSLAKELPQLTKLLKYNGAY